MNGSIKTDLRATNLWRYVPPEDRTQGLHVATNRMLEARIMALGPTGILIIIWDELLNSFQRGLDDIVAVSRWYWRTTFQVYLAPAVYYIKTKNGQDR